MSQQDDLMLSSLLSDANFISCSECGVSVEKENGRPTNVLAFELGDKGWTYDKETKRIYCNECSKKQPKTIIAVDLISNNPLVTIIPENIHNLMLMLMLIRNLFPNLI